MTHVARGQISKVPYPENPSCCPPIRLSHFCNAIVDFRCLRTHLARKFHWLERTILLRVVM